MMMTALMADVHNTSLWGQDLWGHAQNRPIGVNYDEVLYADDTLLVSEGTRTMNQLIARIETMSENTG